MKARQAASLLFLSSVLLPPCVFGQISLLGQFDPLSPDSQGLHITNVSISSSYFSESSPGAQALGLPAGMSTGLSAAMLEGSAAFGWSKLSPKSTISINYSPSYMRTFRSSNYHSINQSLQVSVSRRLGSKLTVSSSFQGLVSDFSALLFAPTLYGNLSQVPATFQELLSAMLLGQSANPALAELISAAPLNSSPSAAFLYGGRELAASASVALSYAQSTRSSFNFSMNASRTQFLDAGSTGSSIDPATYIPQATQGSAMLGWSYLLTPRTTAAVNVSSSRVFSRFEDEYATQFTGSLGRTLSQHWFVQGMVGAGYVIPVRRLSAAPPGTEPVYGGSVGYKFKAQTILASYTRSVSDPYGLGAYANSSSTAAWNWNRPGSSTTLSGSVGYVRLTQPTFSSMTSWTAQAGVSRRLQSQLVMSATYSYVQYPERIFLQGPNVALSGVMVGLSWSPSLRR